MVDRSGDIAHNNSNWRDKYLDALDIQETMERQLELLRRVLVRVSASAGGQDGPLDQALDQLHSQVRPKDFDGEQLANFFDELDRVVSGFEQRRDDSAKDICESLINTLRPLQQLVLPRPLKKEISHYIAQLPKRSENVQLYPALLQQLSAIQQQALAELDQPRAGFWQKIRRAGQTADASTTSITTSATSLETFDPDAEITQSYSNVVNEPDAVAGARQLDASEMIAGVSRVLHDMLQKVDVPESIAADVEVIRRRIIEGLNPENLIPTLEHVRDLVIEAYLAANRAFANYLNSVNQELVDIYSALGGAAQLEATRREVSLNLQSSMLQQVATLQNHVAGATELNQLKEQVNSQLGNIRVALDSLQQTEHQQQLLAGQLQALSDKIKTMEKDAETNRSAMEKHRYKAMHDPLTELPNREAYNERVEAEWQRWQRYSHPLTIAVCDLDHFKKINDSFGHQAGDRVLKVISRSIAKRLREVDFFGRYGGEEFVVIMPETATDTALAVLEKIRAAIANTAFNYKDEPLAITLSMGITEFRSGDTVEEAFARADQALYAAKADGRNRCYVAKI